MDDRNNLFGRGPRSGLPGRQPKPQPSPAGQGYDSSRSYGAPSPGLQSQPRGSGGYADAPQGRYSSQGPTRSVKKRLGIQRVEDKQLQQLYIFSNVCAVSPNDFPPDPRGQDRFIRLTSDAQNMDAVVTARPTPGYPDGCIALSDPQRTWLRVGMMDTINGEIFDPGMENCGFLVSIDIEIGFASPKKTSTAQYDQDELAQRVQATYGPQVFAPGQVMLLDIENVPFILTVKTVTLGNMNQEKMSGGTEVLTDPRARGILTPQTSVGFYKAAGSPIKLSGSTKRGRSDAIIAPDFNFNDLGIGGLDKEFAKIFRRAFASRIFPPGLIDKLGIMHVKGMLLYGPPGTGKTLIARQIGKMLNAREPKVINGPEVLNKYVGASEENIRKLFADAEKEYKEKGDDSGLHIIIFDELDAVCKQRGSGAGGGTGVGDSVVNQLLSKLDGVDQLNNVLLIGMTNRKDMIDEALLRPGRLEVQIEISLPDEDGRVQILNIHTAKMVKNGVLDKDVDIASLASTTKNFSGAELSGLVKSATSFAFNRHIKGGTMAALSDDVSDMKVKMRDFQDALTEVKAAYGVAEDELSEALQYGILHYSPQIGSIISDGSSFVNAVRELDRLRRMAVLFHGPTGSGKTALATHIALASNYPFVKSINPEALVGYGNEMGKKDYVHKAFSDAWKSPLSLLILDDIERLVEWNPVGPRMSNVMLQTIMTLIKAPPPKGHRLLILATTSRKTVLDQLDMTEAFDRQVAVPAVTNMQEMAAALQQFDGIDAADMNIALQQLMNDNNSDHVGVGIKTVLTMAESSTMVPDPRPANHREEDRRRGTPGPPAAWFAEQMSRAIFANNPSIVG